MECARPGALRLCDARTHTVSPGSSNDSVARNAELTAAWTTAVLNRSKSCGAFSRFWSSIYNNMFASASDSGIHVTDWLPACCNPATLARILQGVLYLRQST